MIESINDNDTHYTPNKGYIELREEIRNHVSKRFYKNIRSHKSIILVNNQPLEGYKTIKKGDIITIEYTGQDTDIIQIEFKQVLSAIFH